MLILTAGVYLRAKFPFCQVIAPGCKCPFGELHDIALMYQRDSFSTVFNSKIKRSPDQSFAALTGYRFKAESSTFRETNLGEFLWLLLRQPGLESLVGCTTFLKLNPSIDIFGVLPENDDIHLFRVAHRRGNTRNPAYWSDASIQIQPAAQGNIQ